MRAGGGIPLRKWTEWVGTWSWCHLLPLSRRPWIAGRQRRRRIILQHFESFKSYCWQVCKIQSSVLQHLIPNLELKHVSKNALTVAETTSTTLRKLLSVKATTLESSSCYGLKVSAGCLPKGKRFWQLRKRIHQRKSITTRKANTCLWKYILVCGKPIKYS